jgi:hypothetical protein
MPQDLSRWLLWAVGAWAVSITAFALVFDFMLRRERRWRAEQKERSPLPEKLLRPPGFSLQERISNLTDKLYEAALVQMFSVGGFAIGLVWFVKNLRGPIVASLILVVAPLAGLGAGIYYFRRILSIRDEIRNCRLGLLGEQAVAEALGRAAIATAGYVVFHDVPGEKWNVDHVVVGPGGMFVIETKARSKRKAKIDQKEHEVLFDGRTLRFPWCEDHGAVGQADRNVRDVWKLIKGYAPKDLVVRGVLAIPGWKVELLGKQYPVTTINPKNLPSFLAAQERRFTPEQLRPVLARLDECCRTVEF